MPYSMTCSTKILILAITPFLLISWCLLAFGVVLISGFVFGLCLYDFWFYDTDDFTLRHHFPDHPCSWIKTLSAKTTKYIPECWEKSVKEKSNLNSIRAIKNHQKKSKNLSFDHHFLHTTKYGLWCKSF